MSGTLRQADREALARITERLRGENGWANFVTFDRLLQDWSVFVSSLEVGYDTSIYEYANDLDTRAILEAVLSAAPAEIRSRAVTTLQPLDAKFMGATRLARHPVAARPEPADRYRRIPARLGPELRNDLEHYGVL